jgi:hypothetical protein
LEFLSTSTTRAVTSNLTKQNYWFFEQESEN